MDPLPPMTCKLFRVMGPGSRDNVEVIFVSGPEARNVGRIGADELFELNGNPAPVGEFVIGHWIPSCGRFVYTRNR